MKKIFVLLLSLCLVFSLAACGGSPNPTAAPEKPASSAAAPAASSEVAPEASSESSPEASSEAAPESSSEASSEAAPETAAISLAAGDSGAGPATLDLLVCTLDVPDGLEYRVFDWFFDTESNTGTIYLGVNLPGSNQDGMGLKFTTGITASSYEEAIEASIGLKNLDTYSEGKYEMGAENTYGPLTYQAYHTSTEFGEEDYLVSFLDFHGSALTIEIGDTFASGFISDPLAIAVLESIVLK